MVKGLKKRTIMNVTITSPFWKRRRDQIVESVIPYQWGVMNDEIDTTVPDDPAGNQLADNKSHAVANLKVAAGELDDEFHGMVFQDSDVYKWLEEAAYALAYHPDPRAQGAVRPHGRSHRPRPAVGRLFGHPVPDQVRRMGPTARASA